MWKKFKKFQAGGLQDISIWSDKNPFFGLSKKRVAALHKLTFVWNFFQNGGASLDSFFKASYMLENFKSCGIIQRIGKIL